MQATQSELVGWTLTVFAGARKGLVKAYGPEGRKSARRFADKLDLEYGANCCSVQPIAWQS